ncbi:hypothetical protein C7M84_012569 [Penaeus vannamei]|uniref:Uncharacterized protein n=1 Tax=Penaeus vannamei TaxID=6689 RepID=A0A3R7MTA2_PENVA|nr:hypothetical protein C7M84_012569 [Penaeus vannamei]
MHARTISLFLVSRTSLSLSPSPLLSLSLSLLLFSLSSPSLLQVVSSSLFLALLSIFLLGSFFFCLSGGEPVSLSSSLSLFIVSSLSDPSLSFSLLLSLSLSFSLLSPFSLYSLLSSGALRSRMSLRSVSPSPERAIVPLFPSFLQLCISFITHTHHIPSTITPIPHHSYPLSSLPLLPTHSSHIALICYGYLLLPLPSSLDYLSLLPFYLHYLILSSRSFPSSIPFTSLLYSPSPLPFPLPLYLRRHCCLSRAALRRRARPGAAIHPRLGDLTLDPDDLPASSPSPVDLAGKRRPDLKRGLITPIVFPPFAKRRSPSRLVFHSLARRRKLLVDGARSAEGRLNLLNVSVASDGGPGGLGSQDAARHSGAASRDIA